MNDDTIKRVDALNTLLRMEGTKIDKALAMGEIRSIPSADRPQDEEFKNFDRGDLIALIEAQKERIGELLEDRPQGEWIYCEDYVGHDGYECSNCGFFIPWVYDCYADSNFILNYHTCPHCDARMKGTDDEQERAVEQMEYDMLYEPTYNPEDGSM